MSKHGTNVGDASEVIRDLEEPGAKAICGAARRFDSER